MRKNSIKNTRINSEVQKELSVILSELKDPRIDPFTTVTDVTVTTDLKYCNAYISIMGDDLHQKETLEGLNSASGYIRRELASRVNLRNTPEIRFLIDQSLEYGMRMDRLIDEVMAKDNGK